MDTETSPNTQPKKSFLEQTGALIAVISTAVTVGLTIFNAYTKDAIDRKDLELRDRQLALDTAVKQNAADFERSKDQVARLKWIYDDLVPAIAQPASAAKGAQSQGAAVAMIHMVLDSDKAEQLLVALQQSSDPNVREAARDGVKAIVAADNATLIALVDQTNSQDTKERLRATGTLEGQYTASAAAVGEVLGRLAETPLQGLSGSGFINALYFLSRTTQGAWTPDNLNQADLVLPAVRAKARSKGTQTNNELARVEAVLTRVRAAAQQDPKAVGASPNAGG